MSPFEWIIILTAMFGSAIIKNSVGIGAGIFMLPIMSIVLPAKLALGLGAPAMLISDMVGCRSYFKEWSSREIAVLLPAAIIGIGIGAFLVDIIPAAPFRKTVGAMAVIFALTSLGSAFFTRADKQPSAWLRSKFSGISIGFLGGLATTLAHAGGIVWSVYLMQQRLPKRQFVGTIVFMFLITNTLKTISYLFIDILSLDSLPVLLVGLPLIVIGGFVGDRLNTRMPLKAFRCLVLLIIAVMGLHLMIK